MQYADCGYVCAGIDLQQAGLLASLFSGPEALVDPPRPCSISELQAMYSRCAHIPHAWEPLAAVWDTALVSNSFPSVSAMYIYMLSYIPRSSDQLVTYPSQEILLLVLVQRALGKFRGVPAPSFLSVMDNIVNLLRKPVRARCSTMPSSCICSTTAGHLLKVLSPCKSQPLLKHYFLPVAQSAAHMPCT